MGRKRGGAGKQRNPAQPRTGRGSRRRAGTDQNGNEAAKWQQESGYQPNVNQARHEPMPASHHAPRGQEAELRSAEHAVNGVRARPSRRPRKPDGR
jgi:hypothetical protein